MVPSSLKSIEEVAKNLIRDNTFWLWLRKAAPVFPVNSFKYRRCYATKIIKDLNAYPTLCCFQMSCCTAERSSYARMVGWLGTSKSNETLHPKEGNTHQTDDDNHDYAAGDVPMILDEELLREIRRRRFLGSTGSSSSFNSHLIPLSTH